MTAVKFKEYSLWCVYENLESEQTSTVREKQELQKKLKTLEIIQQNFTALLNAPEIQIPVSGKEPTL